GGAARFPARRLGRRRDDFRARRTRLPGLPEHHLQGLSGDANNRAAAVGDLRRADAHLRHRQCLARSTHPGRLTMTAHAPQLVSDTSEVAAEAVAPSPVTIISTGTGAGAGTDSGTSIRRRIVRNKAVLVGGGLLLAILLVALFAPWLAPHDPY